MVLVLALTEETVRDNDIKTVRGLFQVATSTRATLSNLMYLLHSPSSAPYIQQIFKAIHNAYISYLSNPFNQSSSQQADYVQSPISSQKFEAKLRDIALSQDSETERT